MGRRGLKRKFKFDKRPLHEIALEHLNELQRRYHVLKDFIPTIKYILENDAEFDESLIELFLTFLPKLVEVPLLIYQQGKLFAEQPYLVFLPPRGVDVDDEEYEKWNETIEMTTRSRVTWVCHVINIDWESVRATNNFSEGEDELEERYDVPPYFLPENPQEFPIGRIYEEIFSVEEGLQYFLDGKTKIALDAQSIRKQLATKAARRSAPATGD